MLRKFAKRISLNFKHSRSDRAAISSYRNYHNQAKKILGSINFFTKIKKKS